MFITGFLLWIPPDSFFSGHSGPGELPGSFFSLFSVEPRCRFGVDVITLVFVVAFGGARRDIVPVTGIYNKRCVDTMRSGFEVMYFI